MLVAVQMSSGRLATAPKRLQGTFTNNTKTLGGEGGEQGREVAKVKANSGRNVLTKCKNARSGSTNRLNYRYMRIT